MTNQVNQVFQTTDYNKFNLVDGNRNVNKLHVKRLVDSFGRMYLMSPILVNEDFQIIDGQHRFNAAFELNLPINYIVQKGYGLKEVQILNTNMKNWKKEDYLNGYCDLKYPEYLRFRNFMRQFPDFPIVVCEILLAGSRLRREKKEDGTVMDARDFAEGNLKIKNYNKSCEYAHMLLKIKPYYDGFNRRSFVLAMLKIFENENFDFDKFLQKLERQPTALQHCVNEIQYRMLIEDVYNWRNREKVSLRY